MPMAVVANVLPKRAHKIDFFFNVLQDNIQGFVEKRFVLPQKYLQQH